jgi:hypothetical protein
VPPNGLSTPDSGCTTAQPRRLQVSLVTAPNVPVRSDVIACTDDSRTSLSLRNTGVAVWVIALKQPAEIHSVTEDAESDVFRQAFGSDERLITPGRGVAVPTAPQDVTWTPDVAMSGSWLVHDYAVGMVIDYGRRSLAGILASNPARRDALVACVQAAYQTAVQTARQPAAAQVDALMATWNIRNSAGICGASWQRADYSDIRNKQPYPRWQREIALWAEDPGWQRRAGTVVGRVIELHGVARSFLK